VEIVELRIATGTDDVEEVLSSGAVKPGSSVLNMAEPNTGNFGLSRS